MELVGRLTEASNATFLATIDGRPVVYKPTAGEAPLWDFPSGTLGRREVAAHELSRAAGFEVVPRTAWVEDAPLGPGSVQDWVESDGDELADLVPAGEGPAGWFPVVSGIDPAGNAVELVHADHPALRRLALFDVLANNADRKADHVIRQGERVFGVDHGVSFHAEHKLRTILWGWAGSALEPDEIRLVSAAREVARGALGAWLGDDEVTAVEERAEGLLRLGRFPHPEPGLPAIPWPPI